MIYSFSEKFIKLQNHIYLDVKFAADSKYVLEIFISCLVSEIWVFVV